MAPGTPEQTVGVTDEPRRTGAIEKTRSSSITETRMTCSVALAYFQYLVGVSDRRKQELVLGIARLHRPRDSVELCSQPLRNHSDVCSIASFEPPDRHTRR